MQLLSIKNIAFYAFFKPAFDLRAVRTELCEQLTKLGVKGTILLAPEGINASLAGPEKSIDAFLARFTEIIGIPLPVLKVSYSEKIPFTRTLVKVKPAIVAEPGPNTASLPEKPAPYISPEKFHQWIE